MPGTAILVVEDERIVATAIGHALRFLGYSLAGIADSAEQAVQMAGELQPDLVLMDIRLRGQDAGLTAAVEIQEQLDIPVVYLTAYADRGMVERANQTEPYGYLVKPFKQSDLRSAIDGALARHRSQRELGGT